MIVKGFLPHFVGKELKEKSKKGYNSKGLFFIMIVALVKFKKNPDSFNLLALSNRN